MSEERNFSPGPPPPAALGVCASASSPVPRELDQYASIAAHYDRVLGSLEQRSDLYKSFFPNLLKQHGCVYVLDAACGTGVDSIILLEHGFKVVSIDASAHMLEFAKKKKAERAGDPRYDDWIIERATWESLPEALAGFLPARTQFDAVVCLANSISHVADAAACRRSLAGLARCVRPAGLLLVDHRNYDAVLDGLTPGQNVYYKYQHPVEIKSTLVMEGGQPKTVTMEFCVDQSKEKTVRLSHYPHRVASFSWQVARAVQRAAGAGAGRACHRVLGDFQPLGAVRVPGFYLHVVRKPR